MTESNQEFEQTAPMVQLFYRYFRGAEDHEEVEYLYLMGILNYLQKKSTIPLSSNKVNYFGRLLQKAGIPSKHTNRGRLYKVVKL